MPRRKTLEETTDARAIVTISLTQRANLHLNRWLDRHGGMKSKLLERLLEFFARAPESVQQLMAGTVPADLQAEFAQKASAYFASLEQPVGEQDLLVQLAATASLTPDLRMQIAKLLEGASRIPASPAKKKTA